MKRILINATQAEEIRVALCKGNHLYDFDLENRTREQKKANIYKGHVTRVEPSLEAVFVEYGSERQGFLPIREIANEFLSGDPKKSNNIRELIKAGDELIVQVEKEERGNKGAALSTFISLAGRYLVLMPNNASGGGISRQISGQTRDELKRMLSKLRMPKGMSVIIRTAGVGRSQEDLQNDLDHLLGIWKKVGQVAQNTKSPCLAHQEAGVVTRAVRDYLRDDIAEVWVDNEQAYNEAYNFVQAVMPHQVGKLKKYLNLEPLFTHYGVETQIETAYSREVKLPSGGSIVIDQTEALVSIDINSAKATRGADVEATATNTNLEAADEIARQLRLRDMGGLVVIDFIDMNDSANQRSVEQRLRDATQYDRARIQFGQISRFGLMEMSRQRLRPSLEEATGYVCPRCHGTGMIRDLRSLSLSIMRNIEKIALREGRGEVQVEVPIEIGAFLLNEKRDALVYLEQDSSARITILPNAHMETPEYKVHFNRDGYAPSSYERVSNRHEEETKDLGYDTDWQTQPKRTSAIANYPNSDKTSGKQARNGKNGGKSGGKKGGSKSNNRNNKNEKYNKQGGSKPRKPNQAVKNHALTVTNAQPTSWIGRLLLSIKNFFVGDTAAQSELRDASETKSEKAGKSRSDKSKSNKQKSQNKSEQSSDNGNTKNTSSNKSSAENKSVDNEQNQGQGKRRRRGGKRNNRNRNKQDSAYRSNNQDSQQNRETGSKHDKPSANNNSSNQGGNNQEHGKNEVDLPTREAGSKRSSRGTRDRNKDYRHNQSSNQPQADRVAQGNNAQEGKSKPLNPNRVNLDIVSVAELENANAQDNTVHIDLDGSVAKQGQESKQEQQLDQPSEQTKQQPAVDSPQSADEGLQATQPHNSNDAENKQATVSNQLAEPSSSANEGDHVQNVADLTSDGVDRIENQKPAYTYGRAKNDVRDVGLVAPVAITGEVLSVYHANIQSTNTSQNVAGSSDATPPKPSRRAVNDPRGPAAEVANESFEESKAKITGSVSLSEDESVTADEPVHIVDTSKEKRPTEAVQQSLLFTEPTGVESEQGEDKDAEIDSSSGEPIQSVVAHDAAVNGSSAETAVLDATIKLSSMSTGEYIVAVLGEKGAQMISEGNTAAAFIEAVNQQSQKHQ